MEPIAVNDNEKLTFHLGEVLSNNRRFENSAQAVARMILEKGKVRVTRGGRTTYDFPFFREGKVHIVGWFEEINDFVNFVEYGAKGGPPKTQAFVLVGEPGNGKTFFVDYICAKYRVFLTRPMNRRYTVVFINLKDLGTYGNIKAIESQTFEDPVILAMNLFESRDESREYLSQARFTDVMLERLYDNYRPLGACTEYIWNDIRRHCDGDIKKMLEFVKVIPVTIAESLGTVTGKYSAKDKITSSATDLLGDREITRILNLQDTFNPYKYNVRLGALARVAGGGIHFSDEFFRNKPDLVQIYLQVIQNRNIELEGNRWPIDSLIIGTSNNDVYNEFTSERKEAPIKDRCQICYVSHNTDYKLQHTLTGYTLVGSDKKLSMTDEELHIDPNLVYALSVAVTLTRLPHTEKLDPMQTMKLEAGESAAEKSVKILQEIKDTLNANQDVTKRWGQKGIGHRGLGRIIQNILELPETHEGKCLLALDCFNAAEQEVINYVPDAVDRDKYLKDLGIGKEEYRRYIEVSIFNAYLDDPDAVRKDVMRYINMIVGIASDQLGPDKNWRYKDRRTGEYTSIKIDERFIDSVETRLNLTIKEKKENHRDTLRRLHGQKMETEPNYNFMDQASLIKAVTEVRLKSDVAGMGSLVGALGNRTNDETVQLRNKMLTTMRNILGYCETCATKTIEFYCEKEAVT